MPHAVVGDFLHALFWDFPWHTRGKNVFFLRLVDESSRLDGKKQCFLSAQNDPRLSKRTKNMVSTHACGSPTPMKQPQNSDMDGMEAYISWKFQYNYQMQKAG